MVNERRLNVIPSHSVRQVVICTVQITTGLCFEASETKDPKSKILTWPHEPRDKRTSRIDRGDLALTCDAFLLSVEWQVFVCSWRSCLDRCTRVTPERPLLLVGTAAKRISLKTPSYMFFHRLFWCDLFRRWHTREAACGVLTSPDGLISNACCLMSDTCSFTGEEGVLWMFLTISSSLPNYIAPLTPRCLVLKWDL